MHLLNIAIYQTILQYFSQSFLLIYRPLKIWKIIKIFFFSDEAELLNMINLKTKNKLNDFFYLNKKHIKWKKKINEEFL